MAAKQSKRTGLEIPEFVEALFQRAMRDEELTIEEFLSAATWAYRAIPKDLRARACIRVIYLAPDLRIEYERELAPGPDSRLH